MPSRAVTPRLPGIVPPDPRPGRGRSRFGRWGRLKIALQGQHQQRGSRDQQQIVIGPRSPAGHQACIRRAWRRRRAAAQPSNVAVKISPARSSRLSRAEREGAAPAAPCTRIRCRGIEQDRRGGIPHGLDLVRLDRAGLDGDAQAAGQRGEVPRSPPEPAGCHRGTDGGNHQQQGADDAEGGKPAIGNFNPAKQRHDADQAGSEQENARCGKQPGGDGVRGDRIGRLAGAIAQIGPGRQLDLVELQPQPGAQPIVRRREHTCCSSMTAPMPCHG